MKLAPEPVRQTALLLGEPNERPLLCRKRPTAIVQRVRTWTPPGAVTCPRCLAAMAEAARKESA